MLCCKDFVRKGLFTTLAVCSEDELEYEVPMTKGTLTRAILDEVTRIQGYEDEDMISEVK